MRTGWSLLENPFEISTRGNYTKMLQLCNYTNAALHGQADNAFFLQLYNQFNPLVNQYKTTYTKWHNEAAIKQGETLNLVQLLKQLNQTLAGKWNVAVQVQYPKGSARYKEIFPEGVKLLHNGKRDIRIETVAKLGKSMGSDALLAVLKAEVEAFAALLHQARAEQLGSKMSTKTKSEDVESLRLQVAVAMMSIYGNLVVRYAQELEMIEPFFNVETLRDKRQKVFTRKLKPHQHQTLVKRTLAPDDEIKLHNTGAAELLIGLCPAKGMACTTGVNIAAGKTLTVTASQLGDVANYKFMTLTNLTAFEGSCVVTLV